MVNMKDTLIEGLKTSQEISTSSLPPWQVHMQSLSHITTCSPVVVQRCYRLPYSRDPLNARTSPLNWYKYIKLLLFILFLTSIQIIYFFPLRLQERFIVDHLSDSKETTDKSHKVKYTFARELFNPSSLQLVTESQQAKMETEETETYLSLMDTITVSWDCVMPFILFT